MPNGSGREVTQVREVAALLCAFLVVAPSCAHPRPEIPVGPCPDELKMKPPLEVFCGANRRGSDYIGRVHRAILRSLGWPLSDGVTGFVSISYGEGPTVESVCWSEFGGRLEESQLIDMARRAGRVRVPRQLACFEGHRLVHQLLERWDGPLPELPPGWKPL